MARRKKKSRPVGKWCSALVTLVRRAPKRAEPLEDVLALMKRSRDPGLRAVLEAWAHHDSPSIRVDEWVLERFAPDGSDGISLGTLANGDPVRAGERYVFVGSHETGETERVPGLEGFLSNLQFRALDAERKTPLDDVS